jgi:hypothetical protein
MADGWITIGTKLETDKFERQLNKLDDEIKKQDEKKIEIEAEITTKEEDIGKYEKAKSEIRKYQEELKKLKSAKKEIEKQPGYVYVTQFGNVDYSTEYKDVQHQIDRANKKLQKQKEIASSINIDKLRDNYEKLQVKQENINNKITEYKQKAESIKLQKQVADADKLKEKVSGLGGAFQKSVKSAAKLALSIFAVRSAYMALRRASSELATYDDQYATNLEYIRFALTQAIAPVLRYIVNLAAQLLSYINAIANAWFGLNLFGNASVDDFNKMKKGASGVAGAVQEIKKQLAGFDEMNVLSDNSSSGGGGGSSATMPEFDLSAIQGDVPEWMQWIFNNGDLLKKIIEGIASAIISAKLGLDALQGVGVFLIIDGIVELIKDIQDFVNNPSVQKIGEILQDIGEILIGFSFIAGLTSPLGIILAVIGQIVSIIGGLIQYITNIIDLIKNPSWDGFVETWRSAIKSMGIVGQILDWLIDFIVTNVFGGWDSIKILLSTIAKWINDNVITPIKNFLKPMIDFVENLLSTIWNVAKSIFNTIWSNIKILIDNIKQIVSGVFSFIQTIFSPIVSFFAGVFGTVFNVVKSIFSGIGNFFAGIWDSIKGVFGGIGQKIGEVIGGAFRGAVNGILWMLENTLNSPIRAINSLTSVINAVPGVNLGYLNEFRLPRLATGGIINMPNRRSKHRWSNSRRKW